MQSFTLLSVGTEIDFNLSCTHCNTYYLHKLWILPTPLLKGFVFQVIGKNRPWSRGLYIWLVMH